MNQGFIQIYTGQGKGKTTAALGVALRAAGAGLKTLLIQFMKDGFPYSELNSLLKLTDWIRVERFGGDAHVLEKRPPTDLECRAALRGLELALEAFQNREFEVLILDEICVAVHFGLLKESAVSNLLAQKPGGMELILTGRYCPASWLELADLVTEFKDIKHYYTTGVLSRAGIDC